MLDLTKETFEYKNWVFTFYRSPIEMYILFAVGKKDNKVISLKLPLEPPVSAEDRLYSLEYMEKEEKKAIEYCKQYIEKGCLELL